MEGALELNTVSIADWSQDARSGSWLPMARSKAEGDPDSDAICVPPAEREGPVSLGGAMAPPGVVSAAPETMAAMASWGPQSVVVLLHSFQRHSNERNWRKGI